MEQFQRVVIGLAIVIFLSIIAFLLYMLFSTATKGTWPPTEQNCPDYYIDVAGDGSMCRGVTGLAFQTKLTPAKTIGTVTIAADGCTGISGMNAAGFVSGSGAYPRLCAKNTMAAACGATWDGVTYGSIVAQGDECK